MHKEKYMADFGVEKAAEDLANDFVNEKITSAQLRKFYNEFKGLERKYQTKMLAKTSDTISKDDILNSILPQIKIMKAKVSYAKSRKVVPQVFEDWLKKSVDDINSAKEFEAFLLHFEAIVGYAYGTGKLKD